ncbi:MAG: CotH kinase family protein [Cyclobacteriaceae bacterium]
MSRFKVVLASFIFLVSSSLIAQDLVINEVMSSNASTLTDEDGHTPDWIELYNRGTEVINLEGLGLSDDKENRWVFPAFDLNANNHVLVYASGKDRKDVPLHWETVVDWGDSWKYLVPTSEPNSEWKEATYDDSDSDWQEGESGFGYGDGDDATLLDNPISVFIRKSFTIESVDDIGDVILDMDFDDSFVAYINGQEIARDNISSNGPPAFDQAADNFDHEASMYQGVAPNRYTLGNISDILIDGTNIIAIQIHNHSTNSSDLTAIPFLTLGHISSGNYLTSEFLNLGQEAFHSDFKISSDGETIYLTEIDGNHLDSVEVSPLRSDISYGRVPDGAQEWGLFDKSTPGASNGSIIFTDYASEVAYSVAGGLYGGALELELSTSDAEDLIYYTQDGSSPDEGSILYDGSIAIESTMVIRAIATSPTSLKGKVSSQTYIVGASHGALPIVSISTDSDNLWDWETGIYELGPNAQNNIPHFGANFWNDWEIPASVQLIESDGSGFSMNAGVKIFGGWSRANAQKSLAIHFRKSYDGSLKYNLFPDQDIDEYHAMVLRNSGNDWNRSMFRDGLMNTLVDESIDKQAFRPSVVYLNGEYWGILNIREKVNEDFLASHRDEKANEISILEQEGTVVEGNSDHFTTLRNYIQSNDLSLASNYEYVQTQMDVQNFIKYQVVNIFVDNTDWPGNNIKFWKADHEESKWKWITYDKDFGFNLFAGRNNNNTLAFALNPNGPNWPNPPWSTLLLRELMENEFFKEDFVTFFSDELNSTYQADSIASSIDLFENQIEGEIASHMNKWDGSFNDWQSQVSRLRSFARGRQEAVWGHLSNQFSITRRQLNVENDTPEKGWVKLNSLAIKGEEWSGFYFEDIPVEVKAIAEPGFIFLRWEGHINSVDPIISLNLTQTTTIKAVFGKREDIPENVVINEFVYRSSEDADTGDWIELKNAETQIIDISGWILKDNNDENSYSIPDNTFIAADSYLILAQNQLKLNTHLRSNVQVVGDFDFGLSSDGDCIRLYDDEGNIHDEICYETLSPWPNAQEGVSIALIDSDLDNADGSNWFSISNGGTPGDKNEKAPELSNYDIESGLLLYPNPTLSGGTIDLPNLRGNHVSVILFDEVGKQVLEIFNDMINLDQTTIEWTDQDLKPGIYFVRIKSQNFEKSVKLIVE